MGAAMKARSFSHGSAHPQNAKRRTERTIGLSRRSQGQRVALIKFYGVLRGRLDWNSGFFHRSHRQAPDLRFDCNESQLGGVESREPLSPPSDQSLNV